MVYILYSKKKKWKRNKKSSRGVVFNGEQFCHPRNIWKHFWFLYLGGGGAAGFYWVEVRDAARLPTMPGMAPTAKNDLAPVALEVKRGVLRQGLGLSEQNILSSEVP